VKTGNAVRTYYADILRTAPRENARKWRAREDSNL
jgi:hypothetical protein